MQYLSELPEISSIDQKEDVTEFEFENEIEKLPELGDMEYVVLTARFCDCVVISVGKIIEHEDIHGPEVWTRMKIKGHTIQFSI